MELNREQIIKELEELAKFRTCPEYIKTALALIKELTTENKRLQSHVNRLKKYDEERDIALHARLISETKAKTAREIFEKIDKIIDEHHSGCYEYEDGDECDTAITYISYISADIDVLKKKYTEERE